MTRRRRLAFGCLFAAILGVVSLGLLEVVLRAFMGHVLGPVETRGHVEEAAGGTVRLTPGFEGSLTIAGRTTRLRTNSVGLRGDELPAPPSQGGPRRVLVLGDSMTFGWGVEEDEAFPAALGEIVRASLPDVCTLNGGVPGYGTREVVLALERLDPVVAPAAIVACIYVGNDFEDDVVVDKAVVDGFLIAGHKAEIARGSTRVQFAMASRVWLLFERLWGGVFPESSLAALLDRDAERYHAAFAGWPDGPARSECLFMDADPGGAVQREAFARVAASLDRLAAIAGARPLVVVVLPTRWHCIPEDLAAHALARHESLGLDPRTLRAGKAIDTVLELARERGLPCVDPRATLREDLPGSFIAGDGHFTKDGNRRVAAAIAPVLVRELRE